MLQPAASLTFSVPGQPAGWQRARTNGKRRFDTPEQEARKAEIQIRARRALAAIGAQQVAPAGEPLRCFARAVFDVPKSWPKWRRAEALAGRIHPTSRPDGDNILKLLGDALNGVVWSDDAQVIEWGIVKVYGEQPAVHVEVVQA